MELKAPIRHNIAARIIGLGLLITTGLVMATSLEQIVTTDVVIAARSELVQRSYSLRQQTYSLGILFYIGFLIYLIGTFRENSESKFERSLQYFALLSAIWFGGVLFRVFYHVFF